MAQAQGLPHSCELRHLNFGSVHKLGQILSFEEEWKIVMSSIPYNLSDIGRTQVSEREKRFTSDHVELISARARSSGKYGFEVLVEEWGTMGRNRPTLTHLLLLCLECRAIRAASYINQIILRENEIKDEEDVAMLISQLADLVPESTADPTTAFQDVDNLIELSTENLSSMENTSSSLDDVDNSDFLTIPGPYENALEAPQIPINYLKKITENFGSKGPGRLVGSGGFADVYLGITLRSKHQLAVKKLRDSLEDPERKTLQFNYEVGELARLKHNRIVQLLAYSNDDSNKMCLIYPFYKNGTLEKRLTDKKEENILNYFQRFKIIKGVAQGLHYLHTRPKKMIHRDVKPSNILLDDNLSPKLADFGLLRHASTNNTETVTIKGTPLYMAPEALHGDISEKVDVYSFGVVTLETLTGVVGLVTPDQNEPNSKIAQLNYIDEILEQAEDEESIIMGLLDSKANFPRSLGLELFKLSQNCTLKKSQRPVMMKIRQLLSEMLVPLPEST